MQALALAGAKERVRQQRASSSFVTATVQGKPRYNVNYREIVAARAGVTTPGDTFLCN